VWVPADLPVSTLIDRLQEEQQEVALVHDEAVAGFVTLTDAFEAIAGEMEDPVDASDTTYA
jgi:CBS domain containing-hemolysin-like protein